MTEQAPQPEKKNTLSDVKTKVANVSAEKRWAMSCYLPVVNLLTCMLASVKMVGSKFCRFHARQGLMVFVIWVVATLVGFISPTLSLMLLGIFLVLCIAGMMIAYGGKETSIPLLGQFAEKIPEYYIFKLLTGKIPEQDGVEGVDVSKETPVKQNDAQEGNTKGDVEKK